MSDDAGQVQGRVYQAPSGEWSWGVSELMWVEVAAGAGYANEGEAGEAMRAELDSRIERRRFMDAAIAEFHDGPPA